MSIFESNDGKLILLWFLVKCTEDSPSLRVFLISLNFGFKTKNSFINFTLSYQLFSLFNKILLFEFLLLIFIFLLKLNNSFLWWHKIHSTHHVLLSIEHLAPLSHHIINTKFLFCNILSLSLLLPELDHFIKLLLCKSFSILINIVLFNLGSIVDLFKVSIFIKLFEHFFLLLGKHCLLRLSYFFFSHSGDFWLIEFLHLYFV